MAVRELRREPNSVSVEPSNLIAAVALKAEAVLGYSWLRKKLGIEPGSLSRTLDELGIEPFRLCDVRKYKREKARNVEEQVIESFRERALRGGFREIPPGTYVRATWAVVPLENYEGEVPAFALSHALEVKERIPTAHFEVEELRVEKRYDPFLVVCCDKERFYIDVWEEEEFENEHV